MKKLATFIIGVSLSICASAATVVTHTNTRAVGPVTGVWNAATGVVTGVGNVVTDTWHGVVGGTRTTTKAVHTDNGTAVRHTTTRVYH